MNEETKKLYVFGYGIPLLVPFLMMMHAVKVLNLGFWPFVAILLIGFAGVMSLTVAITKIKPALNWWILAPLAIATIYRASQGHLGFVSGAFLLFAVVMLVLTIIDVNKIQPIYDGWMKVAGYINIAVTTIILMLTYYLVFTPIGWLQRAMGEDALDQKIDKSAKSYWKPRKQKEFNPDHCERQF